ncbi:hypothetical protein WDV06_19955 [Streptomyces racemochromogenes]|uniref:Uncharacterized protein n=1 Tax=Streptomyces racemochromogenes TaxID=67353 RepID=A0ABW7PG21_9ACTN
MPARTGSVCGSARSCRRAPARFPKNFPAEPETRGGKPVTEVLVDPAGGDAGSSTPVNASTGAVWDHTWHGTCIATSHTIH